MSAELDVVLAGLAAELRLDGRRRLWLEQAWVPESRACAALAEHLYARWFSRWSPPPSGARSPRGASASGEPTYVESLREAVGPARHLDPGWRVVKRGPGWCFVRGERLELFVEQPGQLHPRGARVGSAASLWLPCARPGLVPGFFYAVSRRGRLHRDRPHLKFYLNLQPEAAAPLLRALFRGPRAARLRFEAKVVNDPAGWCRVDAALLYVDPSSYPAALRLLLELHRRHPGWFRQGTPLLTRELARGLALVESAPLPEVGPAESSGQLRSRLLAEGVLAALQRGSRTERYRASVARAFARAGLDLERPWVGELQSSEGPDGPRFRRAPAR